MNKIECINEVQAGIINCAKLQAFFIAAEEVSVSGTVLPGAVGAINEIAIIAGELAGILRILENRPEPTEDGAEFGSFEMRRFSILMQRAAYILVAYCSNMRDTV